MIYLSLEEDARVSERAVRLADVAQLTGDEPAVSEKIKKMQVYFFEPQSESRAVLSVISIISMISKEFPGIEICTMGATDVVVEFVPVEKQTDRWAIPKIILVCGICFFGAAFSIMAFHNDIDIQGLCDQIYMLVGFDRKQSFPILEIGYSLGLGTGIIIFYNHIGKRRLTKDPTPIEVEMRIYEKDVYDTVIENSKRLKKEK